MKNRETGTYVHIVNKERQVFQRVRYITYFHTEQIERF
jgi:hypothetical protein